MATCFSCLSLDLFGSHNEKVYQVYRDQFPDHQLSYDWHVYLADLLLLIIASESKAHNTAL